MKDEASDHTLENSFGKSYGLVVRQATECLKILGARKVIRDKLHTEDPRVLGSPYKI